MSETNPRKGERACWPILEGCHTVTAVEYYSNGTWHGAIDLGAPIGTKVLSPVKGVISDLNDGVRNQPTGTPGGPGSPSNWILLSFISDGGNPYTLWYQHLNRGLKVRKGQTVNPGTVLGTSGNSGNTYGPHLHLSLLKGRRTGLGRWADYKDRSQNVYPPTRAWTHLQKRTSTPEPEPEPEPIDPIKEEAMLVYEKVGKPGYWLVMPGGILLSMPAEDAKSWTGSRITITDKTTWDRLAGSLTLAR